MRLQPGFTFQIVEAIKQTRIQSPPGKTTLPLSVSAVAGLMVLLLSLSVPYSPLYPIGQLIGSALPSQISAVEDGVIPVDAIEITQIVSLSSEMSDEDFGERPEPQPTNNYLGGGKWERKVNMPTARESMSLTLAVLDGEIYAIGGWSQPPFRALSTVEASVVHSFSSLRIP